MAGYEDQPQQVVAHRLVQRGAEIGYLGLPPRLFVLAVDPRPPAQQLDGAVPGRGHQPRSRVVRQPVSGKRWSATSNAS